MLEQELLPLIGVFSLGVIVGVLATMLFNKAKTGSVSPGKVKQEMEDYQGQVEAHFDETSKKFKQMAEQYKDLYQHMSVGATSLCRPENISPGLTDQTDPLEAKPAIEVKKEPSANKEPSAHKEPSAGKKPSAEKVAADQSREPKAEQKPEAKKPSEAEPKEKAGVEKAKTETKSVKEKPEEAKPAEKKPVSEKKA